MMEFIEFCSKCLRKIEWVATSSGPIPPCPHCEKDQAKRVQSAEVKEALEIADEIQSLVDELPEAAEDFGMSIADKAADIAENIEKFNRVTDNQFSAPENMLDGAKRWLND